MRVCWSGNKSDAYLYLDARGPPVRRHVLGFVFATGFFYGNHVLRFFHHHITQSTRAKNEITNTMGFDIDKHIAWVEHLYDEQQTVEDLKQIYSLDVHYRDPFQEVIGVDRRVHAICEKVFDQMDQISIQVTGHAVNDNVAFISWKMNVTYKEKLETIEGTTHTPRL